MRCRESKKGVRSSGRQRAKGRQGLGMNTNNRRVSGTLNAGSVERPVATVAEAAGELWWVVLVSTKHDVLLSIIRDVKPALIDKNHL